MQLSWEEKYKLLASFLEIPQFIIEHPEFLKGKISSDEDILWSIIEMENHQALTSTVIDNILESGRFIAYFNEYPELTAEADSINEVKSRLYRGLIRLIKIKNNYNETER